MLTGFRRRGPSGQREQGKEERELGSGYTWLLSVPGDVIKCLLGRTGGGVGLEKDFLLHSGFKSSVRYVYRHEYFLLFPLVYLFSSSLSIFH